MPGCLLQWPCRTGVWPTRQVLPFMSGMGQYTAPPSGQQYISIYIIINACCARSMQKASIACCARSMQRASSSPRPHRKEPPPSQAGKVQEADCCTTPPPSLGSIILPRVRPTTQERNTVTRNNALHARRQDRVPRPVKGVRRRTVEQASAERSWRAPPA